MNKIEKLHESIRTLFRREGEKFCYTPGEIERLVCSLNYKQLYSVLCDTAEPTLCFHRSVLHKAGAGGTAGTR